MERTADIKYFKGLEIEATNFFLLPTVIAPNPSNFEECVEVLKEHKADHILLGYLCDAAGNNLDINLDVAFGLANKLMAAGYKVTMEVRPDQLTYDFVERCPEPEGEFGKQFVILMGMTFPHMAKIGPYTTVKLHGKIGSENGGVWCVKAEDFVKAGQFTPWPAYSYDLLIK